jgi:thioredoxin reductase (NADPH)
MGRMDAVIVGSGPAGLEAAINLKIRKKSFMIFGTGNLSSKLDKAPMVDNYLGFPGISGIELRKRFAAHLAEMEIEITPERVSNAYPMGEYFSIATSHRTCEASALILCPGVYSATELPGEAAFLGRGVSYCATCDAPLYKGKSAAVLGYSEEAIIEANFLAEVAAKVFFIPVTSGVVGLAEGIETVQAKPAEIAGTRKAERLVLTDRVLEVDGVYILREAVAPASLVPGLATENGYIATDRDMRTNLPGCFAAGDCTGKPHQYMRAAGQGQTAALNAAAYLDLKARG